MADEIVYADLSLPSGPSSARLPHPSRGFNASSCQRIALWIGWIGNVILLVGVIMLVFQIKQPMKNQEKSCVSEGPTNGTDQEFNLTQFRQSICETLNSSLDGDSKCQLCPVNWMLQKGKCYWLSKEKREWLWAYKDCISKRAQMLMELDLKEMELIQNTGVWIGFNYTSSEKKWSWVNGSLVDPRVVAQIPSTPETSCGTLKQNTIGSKMCSEQLKWICQKAVDLF